MFGFLTPPRIPGPVKPDDFTRAERDRLRDVVTGGDPLRPTRDRTAINTILTNQRTEITGPTGAFTLAQRQHGNDMAGQQIAGFLGESSMMEEERRFMSEDRLGQLESERKRDLDEYEQLVQAHQAAEEVARKNWQSGLLRAGTGLLSVAAPGIGTAVGGLLATKQTQPTEGFGFNAMSPDAVGRYAGELPGMDNEPRINPLAVPNFNDFRGPRFNRSPLGY